jgi:hypothetical protein
MIKLNATYQIGNGENSVVFTEGKKGSITGTHNEGTLTGFINGNVLNGTFHNTKVNATGLIEITFHESGFQAKWKNGMEPGPMRGKWVGVLENISDSDQKSNSIQQDVVEITLSGRIPKYFFGLLKEEFREEIKSIIGMSIPGLLNEQTLLTAILKTTLEDYEDDRAYFEQLLKRDEIVKQCPNLVALYQEIEEYNLDHFGLYEALFDTADYWPGGTGFVSFFEDDCNISISVNGESTMKEISLGEFSEISSGYHTENGPENDSEKSIDKLLKDFITSNMYYFGLSEDMGVNCNKLGVMFAKEWFVPPVLEDVCDRKYNVTIQHDDIIDYTFYFETENFDFKKLLFLTYANYADFRNNSSTTFANYIFYDNEILTPDETWHRDKGIELEYEPRGTSLDFLING